VSPNQRESHQVSEDVTRSRERHEETKERKKSTGFSRMDVTLKHDTSRSALARVKGKSLKTLTRTLVLGGGNHRRRESDKKGRSGGKQLVGKEICGRADAHTKRSKRKFCRQDRGRTRGGNWRSNWRQAGGLQGGAKNCAI